MILTINAMNRRQVTFEPLFPRQRSATNIAFEESFTLVIYHFMKQVHISVIARKLIGWIHSKCSHRLISKAQGQASPEPAEWY